MDQREFQIIKAIAVFAALTFVVIIQLVTPYEGKARNLFKNWKVNVPLAMINSVVLSLACGGCACMTALWAETNNYGLTNLAHVPALWRIVVSLFILDFTAYAWHRANHRLSLLWRFHAVHHSDQIFEVSTGFRFHIGELAISMIVRLAVVAAFGLPVLGILVFEVLYVLLNLFEHGNIRLSAGPEQTLEKVFVTPALHRKHHSVDLNELNSNFSTIFSFWDRAFRTYLKSQSTEMIVVGLPGAERHEDGLVELLRMPLKARAGPI